MQGAQKLDRLRESELVHGRWAMLGVVGCLLPEILGFGDWFEAPLWAVNGGTPSYFGVPVPVDVKTIILVEIVAMAGVEILRNEESEPLKRAYPGLYPLLVLAPACSTVHVSTSDSLGTAWCGICLSRVCQHFLLACRPRVSWPFC